MRAVVIDAVGVFCTSTVPENQFVSISETDVVEIVLAAALASA